VVVRRALLPWLALVASGCSQAGHDASPPLVRAAGGAPADSIIPTALRPPPAELAPFERAIAERMRGVAETMVEVEMRSGDQVVGHGSGVLVSPNGEVVTAAHVVRDASLHFRVVLPDGPSRDAVVAAVDEAHDAAILRAPGAATAFARLAAHRPMAGDWLVCAGYGGEQTIERTPMLSAGVAVEPSFGWSRTEGGGDRFALRPLPKKTTTYWGMIRSDCWTAPGMSGGPVVDLDGNLVGVVVATGGIATSIDSIRRLLPSARSPAVAAPTSPSAAPAPVTKGGADGLPSRDATLAAMFAPLGAERSVFDLEVGTGPKFPAVLVTLDGLAVTPAARVTNKTPDAGEVTVASADVVVVGRPDARCTEIVAVRGELALLRLSGLLAPASGSPDALVPVGFGGGAALGQLVVAVEPTRRSVGFVTAVDRHPGTTAPDAPKWSGGCGTIRMKEEQQFRRDYPPVLVTSALAHDGDWPSYGSLVVDRSGRPIAIDVAMGAPGLTFAVPWWEVLARFDEWLRPESRSAPE
jgi:S1-C subfamily serine protease